MRTETHAVLRHFNGLLVPTRLQALITYAVTGKTDVWKPT
jgi:hypothetical protein